MVTYGIDEMTIVLMPLQSLLESEEIDCWEDLAELMLDEVCEQTSFFRVFGRGKSGQRMPQGYSRGWTLGEHDFYLAFAYNPNSPSQGVVIKLSAQALAHYMRWTGKQAHDLLKDVYNPAMYEMRPSRIDLKADFIDEGIVVDEIYRGLMDNTLCPMRHQKNRQTGRFGLRKSTGKVKHYGEGESVQTIELGSKKANTNVMLRIYDKKAEQIAKKGVDFIKASDCDDWVRFEMVLRHEYARQFSDVLLDCADDEEQARAIASAIYHRYMFVCLGKDEKLLGTAPWSTEMELAANGSAVILSAPSWRSSDLAASVNYIEKGSGLFATLWKIRELWGDDGISAFIGFMLGQFNKYYTPNEDAWLWLRRKLNDYVQDYPTVHDWLTEVEKAIHWETFALPAEEDVEAWQQ